MIYKITFKNKNTFTLHAAAIKRNKHSAHFFSKTKGRNGKVVQRKIAFFTGIESIEEALFPEHLSKPVGGLVAYEAVEVTNFPTTQKIEEDLKNIINLLNVIAANTNNGLPKSYSSSGFAKP